MERILERYERYSYAERQVLGNDGEINVCTLILFFSVLPLHKLGAHSFGTNAI